MSNAEKVFLVHGWSVQETTTYQALHLKLAEAGFELQQVHLGRYVSLDDRVQIRDLARAMQAELVRHLGPPPWKAPFHVVTHSTGALVLRRWIVHHYVGDHLQGHPLRNVVFLAGPHFGSRLAHHGRSMLAHARYRGDTGTRILEALELSSAFSWQTNEEFLDPSNWRDKGIRPYALIGDRVVNDFFKSKIFPAGYEKGSDMVVRVAAGNVNHRRFRVDAPSEQLTKVGEIQDVPFAALASYTHSGTDHGIMNSIVRAADPGAPKYENLSLILGCLAVRTESDYDAMRERCAEVTARTRQKRKAFAQLDFRFQDRDGRPIEDFSFELGAIVDGKEKPSRTVANLHKNTTDPNRLSVFLDLGQFEPQYPYFLRFRSDTGTPLVTTDPNPYTQRVENAILRDLITPDQTTQIDVVLDRHPTADLFVFHPGDDPDLHVAWNRMGQVVRRKMRIK